MLQESCYSQGITHSDIKPANIFIDVRDCQNMTHVLDWGLASQDRHGKFSDPLYIDNVNDKGLLPAGICILCLAKMTKSSATLGIQP